MTLYERDKENFQDAKAEGLEEGIEIGTEETKRNNARALLDVLDDETIAMKIGLSLEIVKALRDELGN